MATTANLIQWLAAGVNTTAGVAVASGVVRFYQPSTLTPQTVYSDDAAASAITQPKVLSAGGTATVYTVNAVRMIVKDALDLSTLWDVTLNVGRDDLIYVTSPAFNGGTETRLDTILDAVSTSFGGTAGLWKYKESSTATERLMQSWMGDVHVSVKDFGALGDDATDDRAAIAAAIARVAARGGGTVYLPPGTYRVSSNLGLTSTGITLVGASAQSSIIKNTFASGNTLTVTASNCGISRLGISHLTSSTSSAISTSTGAFISLEQVSIVGHQTGITSQSNYLYIRECDITTTTSASARGITVTGTNVTVANTRIAAPTGIGVETNSAGPVGLLCTSVTSGATGFSVTGSGNSPPVLLLGCDSNCTADLTIASATPNVTEIGCMWKGGGATASSGYAVLTSQTGASTKYPTRPLGADAYTVDAAGGTAVTPSPVRGRTIRIRATSAGTVTVNATSTAFANGHEMTISFFNNSGGAVTWTLNAIYKVVAAPAPADGSRTTIPFFFDSATTTWIQSGGSSTVVG